MYFADRGFHEISACYSLEAVLTGLYFIMTALVDTSLKQLFVRNIFGFMKFLKLFSKKKRKIHFVEKSLGFQITDFFFRGTNFPSF